MNYNPVIQGLCLCKALKLHNKFCRINQINNTVMTSFRRFQVKVEKKCLLMMIRFKLILKADKKSRKVCDLRLDLVLNYFDSIMSLVTIGVHKTYEFIFIFFLILSSFSWISSLLNIALNSTNVADELGYSLLYIYL